MRLALFDLDRTLLDCNSGRLWMEYEWREGRIGVGEEAENGVAAWFPSLLDADTLGLSADGLSILATSSTVKACFDLTSGACVWPAHAGGGE